MTPMITKPMHYEEYEQMAVMRWADVKTAVHPELKLLFHIPNGGKRNVREAAMLKAAGVKAGVPDLFLPVARGPYHGLFIELKYGKNNATEKQKVWIKDLNAQGYKATICYGFEEAIQCLEDYIDLKVEKDD